MPVVKLTDRLVLTVKPDSGQDRTDYFDEKERGLALRVSSEGHKSWTFHFTSPKDDKRARLTLGTYPATSLAEARTRAIEARGHIEEGRDPRDAFAAEAAGAMTVTMAIEQYLEDYVKLELRSAAEVERRLRKNVIPVIGAVRLADLHRRDLTRVVDPIRKRGAHVEARRVFEDVRAAGYWLVDRGDLDHNPFERRGRRKKSAVAIVPKARALPDEEIRTLWHVLPKALARSRDCQRIIRLCLVTVQRVGEVSGMQLDELDLDEQRLWSIPGSRTKNKHPHTVPLSDLAISIILEALADAGEGAAYVFPAEGGSMPPRSVARTILRAHEPTDELPMGRFGLPRWTAHDLRHTGLTGMAKLGVSPFIRGHVANHLTVTKAGVTLDVYDHYAYAKEKREALDLWANRLHAITQTTSVAKIIPLAR